MQEHSLKRILGREYEGLSVVDSSANDIALSHAQAETLRHTLYTIPRECGIVGRVKSVFDRITRGVVEGNREFYLDILISEEPNAMIFPSTREVFVTTGLLELPGMCEDALAYILGHELAHYTYRHKGRRSDEELVKSEFDFALSNAIVDRLHNFDEEYKADAFAIRLVDRSGYNAYASIAILKSLKSYEEKFTSETSESNINERIIPSFASTHPPTERRVRALESILDHSHLIHQEEEPFAEFSEDELQEMEGYAQPRLAWVKSVDCMPIEELHEKLRETSDSRQVEELLMVFLISAVCYRGVDDFKLPDVQEEEEKIERLTPERRLFIETLEHQLKKITSLQNWEEVKKLVRSLFTDFTDEGEISYDPKEGTVKMHLSIGWKPFIPLTLDITKNSLRSKWYSKLISGYNDFVHHGTEHLRAEHPDWSDKKLALASWLRFDSALPTDQGLQRYNAAVKSLGQEHLDTIADVWDVIPCKWFALPVISNRDLMYLTNLTGINRFQDLLTQKVVPDLLSKIEELTEPDIERIRLLNRFKQNHDSSFLWYGPLLKW